MAGNACKRFCSWFKKKPIAVGSMILELRDHTRHEFEFSGKTCPGHRRCDVPDLAPISIVVTGGEKIGSAAFCEYPSLTSVTLPRGLISIGENAFQYCENLTSVTIPDTVTRIGAKAFASCMSLTSLTLPESLTHVGRSAFSECSGLTSLAFPKACGEKRTAPTSVAIPSSIDDSSFRHCSGITSLTLPQNLQEVESHAFAQCCGLTSITLPDTLTKIGFSAFSCCCELTSLTLPHAVTSIDKFAFADCVSLASLTLPDGLRSIGFKAFRHCSALTSLTLPDTVTSVGRNAFEKCKSLTCLTIPYSLTVTKCGAFDDCPKLRTFFFRPRVTGASPTFIAWAVSGSRKRSNWQLTTVKQLRNVLRLITEFACESHDLAIIDPNGRLRVGTAYSVERFGWPDLDDDNNFHSVRHYYYSIYRPYMKTRIHGYVDTLLISNE